MQDTPIASNEGTLPFAVETTLNGMTGDVGLPVGGFVPSSLGGAVCGGAVDGVAVGADVCDGTVGAAVGLVLGAIVSETASDTVGEVVLVDEESGVAVGVATATMEHVHFPTGKTSLPSALTKTPSFGNPRASAVSPSARIRVIFRWGCVGVSSDL